MLDLILHMDQKLERLCDRRPMTVGEHGTVPAAKRSRQAAGAHVIERRSHVRALNGFRTLLPRVKEEDHDATEDDCRPT